MRVALDTNRYVDLCKGGEESVRIAATAEAVFLPFVVVAELRAGFALGRRGVENERVLRRFLLKDGVQVLFADDQTTHHYANVYRQLRKQGTPVPTNDMWVSALVLQHNLVLHDRDRHFDRLPQIVRVWFEWFVSIAAASILHSGEAQPVVDPLARFQEAGMCAQVWRFL